MLWTPGWFGVCCGIDGLEHSWVTRAESCFLLLVGHSSQRIASGAKQWGQQWRVTGRLPLIHAVVSLRIMAGLSLICAFFFPGHHRLLGLLFPPSCYSLPICGSSHSAPLLRGLENYKQTGIGMGVSAQFAVWNGQWNCWLVHTCFKLGTVALKVSSSSTLNSTNFSVFCFEIMA